MKRTINRALAPLLAATLCTGTVLAGDGSNEPGFVPPPADRKKPPAPPRTASSAETLDACCCCPVTPLSRTEAKKPPKPPVLVTKLRDTRAPEPEPQAAPVAAETERARTRKDKRE